MIEIQASSKENLLSARLSGTDQELFIEMCMILESYIDQLKNHSGEKIAEATIRALVRILSNRLDNIDSTAIKCNISIDPKLARFISNFKDDKDDSDEEKE